MKALHFASYPTVLPQHGGQLRVSAMKKALADAGVEAVSIAAFDDMHYHDFGPLDIPVPDSRFKPYWHDHPWDATLSAVVNNNPDLRTRFIENVRKANADVYVFEHPWLWPLVREVLKTDPDLERPMVFDAHNAEAVLLREMLVKQLDGRLSDHDKWLIEYVFELEHELCEAAELVIACTQSDLDYFTSHYRIRAGAVFSNGINLPSKVSDAVRGRYAKRFEGVRLAGFVGSAHPPNAEGFEALCGDNFGYLPPDNRIAIVGGVCDLIYNRSRENLFVALNDSRCDYLGRLPQEDLDAVLARCDVILLPILTGGGSNLKTAEALVSGKTILSTSLAFRGYDEFRDFPTVNIVDDPKAWRFRLRDLLAADRLPTLSAEQKEQTKSLLWENILKGYPECIKGISGTQEGIL